MMKFFQKLGRALMLPVACMPICGLLMGIGYLLCPASMQGGDISGILPVMGQFMVRAGGAVIDQMPLLFAIGVGVGMTEDNDGTAALAALVSWRMITGLLNPDFVVHLIHDLPERPDALMAFQKIANPFIGIIAGLIGALCYQRFKGTQTPDWLAFFSGKRCVAIVAGVASVLASALLLFVWPWLFGLLIRFGRMISGMGDIGAGLYATLNRLLIPTGLHHALNNVFWFDSIGLGDLTHFWAGHASADVSWSLGVYMSGFFPCMMFGIPGAALAIHRCARPERKKAVAGIMISCALCAFVCGITEPFEFAFMFAAPALYVVYAALYGVFTYVTAITGFRAGFSFSAGAADLLFSASLPAAQRTWLILPLGLAAFAVFYIVFRLMIQGLNLKTPGREDEAPTTAPKSSVGKDWAVMAAGILDGMGGRDNIASLTHCATRLRMAVRDMTRVDDAQLKAAGALGVMRVGKDGVQVIIGTQVQNAYDALKGELGNSD